MDNQEINWQAEAAFWQQKYFEQLMHSTQVIGALSRPMLQQVAAAQAAAQAVQAPDRPDQPENGSAGQSAGRNGASKVATQ